MPRLTIHENGETHLHPVTHDLTSIGRAPTNVIQILDIKSSREHCYVERTDKGYLLVDLQSQNGTLVNGVRVNHHLLKSGDKIEIGTTQIIFEREEGDPAEEPVDAAADVPRPRPLPRRHLRRVVPLRRRTLPLVTPAPTDVPTRGEEVVEESLEDVLRSTLQSYVEAAGVQGLEEAGTLIDEFFQRHAGTSRLASVVKTRDDLLKLQEVGKAINSEHNLKKLLEMIMDTVIQLTTAERGFMILLEGEAMNFRVARNFDREPIKNPEFKISHSLAEGVVKTGKAILTADAQSDDRFEAFVSVSGLKLRSVLCIPFKVKQQVLGCVYIDNRFEGGVFTEETLHLLEAFADQAAIAIENARLLEENIKKQEELRRSKEQVEKLNRLLEEKVEQQSVELKEVKEDLKRERSELALKYDYTNIVGRCAKMRDVFAVLDRVTDTDVPVLVEGESGTGKELVARAIHFNGPRKNFRFVSENCAAIPETLLESELFGYMRGAFTGANQDKKGLFELAHQGTLFLDEIGDTSLEMQKKLLRALQEGEIRRVGGKDVVKVDVRIVSASNKDLKELIKQAKFREDLFYRLNVIKVKLPPLRERKEDIPLLVDHFGDSIARESGQPKRNMDREALRLLMAYDWPGNVRELENEVRRAVALSDQKILPEVLKEEIRQKEGTGALGNVSGKPLKDVVREAVERLEKEVILRVLTDVKWVKTEAARVLGISRPTLDAKIEAYQLERQA
ncbi:MAG: sigma 54-interacting transcriptional regulator [Planctomycetes bacterium]|nr:sigma 54-interacting transcriptional regulator [Planctomycetota bacterium]